MATRTKSRSPSASKRTKEPTTDRKRSATDYDKMVGNNLRMLRLRAGMSQMELAEKFNLSFQQIQKYEKGTNRLHVEKLAQLAEIFDVPVAALMDGVAVDGHGIFESVDKQAFLFMEKFRKLPSAVRNCLVHLIDELSE